jgi:hypothetical protein
MTYSQFLRIKRLSQKNHIAIAAKHNLRELQSERGSGSHIDPTRTAQNKILCGKNTAKSVSEDAKYIMQEAGVLPLRKNAMRAIEIVISLPIKAEINQFQYFDDCLQWVKDFFNIPVLSAVVHLDESKPHMHLLLLPLKNRKMQGDRIVGDRRRIRGIQESFYQLVGRAHGFSQPRKTRLLNLATRKKSADLFYNAMVDRPELLLSPKVQAVLMDLYIKNPEQLLASIGKEITASLEKPP